ncbi:MAG: hypothetical protein ACKVS8_11815 [Phycisphaerales bacterium]
MSEHAATMLTLAQNSGGKAPPAVAIVLLVAAVAVIVLLIWLAKKRDRARTAGIAEALASRGLTLTAAPAKAAKPALFAPFAHVKQMKAGHGGIQWVASGTINGTQIDLCEHMHMQSHGKGSHPVYYSAAVISCPPAWPELTLGRESALHAIAELLGHKDVKLDDEAFNKRWRVHTDDPDFALVFLSPAAQQWLTEAPKNEAWQVGAGRLSCVHAGALKPDTVAALIERPLALVAMIPPELAAWQARATT